jgi:hypothetical protein
MVLKSGNISENNECSDDLSRRVGFIGRKGLKKADQN